MTIFQLHRKKKQTFEKKNTICARNAVIKLFIQTEKNWCRLDCTCCSDIVTIFARWLQLSLLFQISFIRVILVCFSVMSSRIYVDQSVFVIRRVLICTQWYILRTRPTPLIHQFSSGYRLNFAKLIVHDRTNRSWLFKLRPILTPG